MPPEQNPTEYKFNFWETDPKRNFAPWFLKFCLVLIIIGISTAVCLGHKTRKEYAAHIAEMRNEHSAQNSWKTYTNEELGFEFKYPETLTIQSNIGKSFEDERNSIKYIVEPFRQGMVIDCPDKINSAGKFPVADPYHQVECKNNTNAEGLVYAWSSSRGFSLDQSDPSQTLNQTILRGYFLNSSSLVTLVAISTDVDGKNLPKIASDFDQILSTFKFIEPSAEGQFCGGIATGQFPCPSGYSCKLDGTYPDAGGHCIKNN